MTTFYICTKDVWRKEIGRAHIGHYIVLPHGLILLAVGSLHPSVADAWHSHNDVARLQSPVTEANVPLSGLLKAPQVAKNFKPKHMEALTAIGVNTQHTIRDIHNITRKIHPLVRLDND